LAKPLPNHVTTKPLHSTRPNLTAGARTSLAEFLQWEDAQPVRHERVGGRVWAVTGGTLDHKSP
jgi:hypothetical protein